MTNTEHPPLVALDLIQDALEDAPAKSLPGMAYGFARDAYPALEALIAERDALRDTLEALGDADVQPGHVCYLTKAQMAEAARAALAKGESCATSD